MPLYRSGDPWPETIYRGFARSPAAAPPIRAIPVLRRRSSGGLLAFGLTAIVALSVAAAVWSYPALERRLAGEGSPPVRRAPSAPVADITARVPAVTRPAEVVNSSTSTRLDATSPRAADEAKPGSPPVPLAEPASPPVHLSEPASPPEAAEPKAPAPRERRRSQMTVEAGRQASAATERANLMGAFAPDSTLGAQMATEAQRPGY
jgi:hypothetical protein